MNEKLTTRETTEEDKERVLALYPQAFPEEEQMVARITIEAVGKRLKHLES